MSYTPTVNSTDRYATVDIAGERFTYPVSTATIAGVAAPIRGNNLLKASNNFSDASWAAANLQNLASTFDFDGVTFTKMRESTATGGHFLDQTSISGNSQSPSVVFIWFASANRDFYAQLYGTSAGDSYYVYVSGSLGSILTSGVTGTATLSGATVTQLGTATVDGVPDTPIWQLVLRGVGGSSAAVTYNRLRLGVAIGTTASYAGNTSNGVYIAQAQLTEGTERTTYQETSSQRIDQGNNALGPLWSRSGVSAVERDISDPDGGVGAQRLTLSSATTNLTQPITESVGVGDYWRAGVWMKGEGANIGKDVRITVRRGGAGTLEQSFVLHVLTGGWVFVERDHTFANVQTAIQFDVVRTDGLGNPATSVLIYNPVIGKSRLPAYSDYDRPRISGDGQRLTHSGDLSNPAWTKTNVTGAAAGSIAYDHNATLDTGEVLAMASVYETTTNATHVVVQSSDAPANAYVVGMVKVKGGLSRDYIQLRILNATTTTDYAYAIFRFSTGAYSTGATLAGTAVSATVDVTDLGDGVYQLRMTTVCSTGEGVARLQVMFLNDAIADTFAGEITKGARVVEPILVAGSTVPSYTRSYADRLASGGSTRDRAYVQIPHIDDFDAAGIHVGTRWNTEQNWIITDGTDTATSTEQIAPPDAANFATASIGPYQYAPSGVTPGDDAYVHILTGDGVVTAESFTFSPTETSSIRTMAYDIVGSEWLPYREQTGLNPFESASSGVIRSVIRSVIRTVVY